jgi:hypothetical protein
VKSVVFTGVSTGIGRGASRVLIDRVIGKAVALLPDK